MAQPRIESTQIGATSMPTGTIAAPPVKTTGTIAQLPVTHEKPDLTASNPAVKIMDKIITTKKMEEKRNSTSNHFRLRYENLASLHSYKADYLAINRLWNVTNRTNAVIEFLDTTTKPFVCLALCVLMPLIRFILSIIGLPFYGIAYAMNRDLIQHNKQTQQEAAQRLEKLMKTSQEFQQLGNGTELNTHELTELTPIPAPAPVVPTPAPAPAVAAPAACVPVISTAAPASRRILAAPDLENVVGLPSFAEVNGQIQTVPSDPIARQMFNEIMAKQEEQERAEQARMMARIQATIRRL